MNKEETGLGRKEEGNPLQPLREHYIRKGFATVDPQIRALLFELGDSFKAQVDYILDLEERIENRLILIAKEAERKNEHR
jgi:hypothetical protein